MISLRPVGAGLWLAASGMIAVSVAAPVKAEKAAGQIQLELNNTPLNSAIDLLTQRSGARIVVSDPPSLAGKKVSVALNGMSVEQALNTILTATKTPWYKGDDGVYYINTEPPMAPVLPEPPAPSRIVTTEKIELRHQDPNAMVRALGLDPTFPLETSDTPNGQQWQMSPSAANIRPASSMGSNVKSVNVNGQQWDVSNGNAYLVPTSRNVPLSTGQVSASADQANDGIQELDSAGQIGFPRGRNRNGNGNGTNTNGAPGTTGGAPTAGANGQNSQAKLIPDGIDTVFPYQEDNSLLVRGEPDAIDELKNIIALLDVPVRQVSIKAEFVTVSDSDASAFGLNFVTNVLNSNVTSDIGGTGAGPTLTMKISQGNIDATLTALRSNGRARTIQAPLISTLNNVPATIQTSRSFPLFQPQILQGGVGGGGNIVTYQPTYVTASTGLQVTPRVNRDGSVTVQIHPQVSAFAENVSGPNQQTLPVVVQQELFTNRRVRSGESIVLGGLATKNVNHTSRGIPFLQDLPIIGRLFRSSDDTTEDTQLLIFLTPTIVEETSGAQVSPS